MNKIHGTQLNFNFKWITNNFAQEILQNYSLPMWTSNLTGHPIYYLPNLNIIISHGGESCLPAPGSTKAVSTPWPLVMQRWWGLVGAVAWLRVSLGGLCACPVLTGRANCWGRLRAPFGSHNPAHSLRSSTLAYSGVCACWSFCLKSSSPTWSESFYHSVQSDQAPILDISSYWPYKTSLNICILIPAPCSAFFLAYTSTVTWHSYLCIRSWLNLNGRPLKEGNLLSRRLCPLFYQQRFPQAKYPDGAGPVGSQREGAGLLRRGCGQRFLETRWSWGACSTVEVRTGAVSVEGYAVFVAAVV